MRDFALGEWSPDGMPHLFIGMASAASVARYVVSSIGGLLAGVAILRAAGWEARAVSSSWARSSGCASVPR